MKTFRKAAATETRNARKAIASRGGTRSLSASLSPSQHVLSGRLLRRAARSGARIEASEVPGEGVRSGPTIAVEIDSRTRAMLSIEPHNRTILTCCFT